MARGTAHITAIEDPVDCSFLDKYADWRKHLREPTERERWRDERIRRLLKPFLEPHAPLDFLPNSLDASDEKARTEAKEMLESAIQRAQDFLLDFHDPWVWMSKPHKAQDFSPFYFKPVENQEHSADPKIGFERLIRKAREHQRKGEAYLAVVMYSRALYTGPPDTNREITLEACDATLSAGLPDSTLLRMKGWDEIELTNDESDDCTRDSVLRRLTLRRTLFSPYDWVRFSRGVWDEQTWEEERVTNLEMLQRLVARVHGTTFANPDKYYWILYIACTSQYLLLSMLKSPFGTDSCVDDRGHEIITRILFYIWDIVNSEIEGKDVDTADLRFLRFRIAKGLWGVQPYLKFDVGMSAYLGEPDEIYDLGLSAETLDLAPSLIELLRPLTSEPCCQIVRLLDGLVQRKDALRIWGLLYIFRLVGLRSGIDKWWGHFPLRTDHKEDWEEIATHEAISRLPLFTYNIATYHNFHTARTASTASLPPSAPPERLARLAFPFNVPHPGEEERLATASFKALFCWEWQRIQIRGRPAYLERISAPYISFFGMKNYEARMLYVGLISEFLFDPADSWRLVGRVVGLDRTYLSKDYTTRISELQMQIATLGQLADDVERLVSGHKDTGACQGAIRAQLQLLLGEAYLELSELSWPPDIFVRRALGFFEECKRLAAQFDHEEVTAVSLRRLIDVQAKMLRLCRAGVRPEDIYSICLEAEILIRPRRNFWIEKSATSLEGCKTGWRTAAAKSLLRTPSKLGVFGLQAGHIFALASEVSLSQGKPLDALCWIQRGKASVTSGLIIQQRSLARFMSYVAGDRRPRPRSEKEIAKTWWQFVNNEEELFCRASAQQHPTIAKSRNALKRELKQLRDTFEPRSSLITIPGEEKVRVVFVDWSLASETDAYCLCIAPIPGTPQFLSVSIKPSEVRGWRVDHWDRPDKSLEMPEMQSPLRSLDELISPLNSYLQEGDTVILCLTGDLHCLPVHALHLRDELPLIYFHPVVHAPTIGVYLHCLQRCRHLRQKAPSDVPAMAAVYPSLRAQGPGPRHTRVQERLHQAVQQIAASLGADLCWDDAVTRECLLHELQTRGVLCFIGHCISDTDTYLGLQQRLLLSNHEVFSTTDFLDNDIIPSLLVLLGCGTAKHTVPVGDEMMNLIFGALASGATSVLGTLWPIRVETAVGFARSLSSTLKPKEHLVDGVMIDVARATQKAILDLRKAYHKPIDWAGYVLHGSRVMRDIFPRDEEGEVEMTEGS